MDIGDPLSTDDFTVHLAHTANLFDQRHSRARRLFSSRRYAWKKIQGNDISPVAQGCGESLGV
jgi:hypothetical protein